MTERLLRAIACPWVDVIGHPTGRMILKREPYRFDMERVLDAAAAAGVALEINSQIDRLDLDEAHAKLARERGVKLVIDSDAHSPAALGVLRWGAAVARRAWLEPDDVLNTRPLAELPREPPAPSKLSRRSLRIMPADRLAEIKRLYFKTTRATIDRDFDRAIDLLKEMPEDERHRATVYMEGLAEMRKEFKRGRRSV